MIISTDPPCRFLIKPSNTCRFSCSRVFFSAPYDETLHFWPISLAASVRLTLHSTSFCLPSAFCWLFNSRKTLLEGEFAIYFRRQKMKRGFSTLYLLPLFVFILYASLLSAPLWSLFIQLGPPCFHSVLGVRGPGEHGWLNARGAGWLGQQSEGWIL